MQSTIPTIREGEAAERPTSSSNAPQVGQNAPLVIVSQGGKHSDESRRIVRAQAARASAAQSRLTRARNREGKDGVSRETTQAPSVVQTPLPTPISEQPPPIEVPTTENAPVTPGIVVQKPLVAWLASVAKLTPAGLLQNAQSIAQPSVSTVADGITNSVTGILGTTNAVTTGILGVTTGAVTGILSATGAAGDALMSAGEALGGAPSRPQLPQIVPPGFSSLQHRIRLSDNFMDLVKKTNCFDFHSPGLEQRIHQLLFDLIVGYVGSALSIIPLPGHPIQGHLRIACTCVTIFQGQRADGDFASPEKYQQGLDAAWSEATALDQGALKEPDTAGASLWAVFIISVTTGSTTNFFLDLIRSLFDRLNLSEWRGVRNVLKDFIYPGSFLDKPCQTFYDNLLKLPTLPLMTT